MAKTKPKQTPTNYLAKIEHVECGQVFIYDNCDCVIPFSDGTLTIKKDGIEYVRAKHVRPDGTYKSRDRWHDIAWGTVVDVTPERARPERIKK